MGEKEPWWALTPEERRSLAITFVGGVGSIVVAAAVIGGAIAAARFLAPHPTPIGLVSFAVGGLLCLVTILGELRSPRNSRRTKWFTVLWLGILTLAVMVDVLALIGVAAGIH